MASALTGPGLKWKMPDLLDSLGTDGGDTLVGTRGADRIQGLGGDDVLSGGSGNDVLEGGAGADVLKGGNGQDVLWGEAPDAIFADPLVSYDDVLSGGNGKDRLYGQEGNDTLYGGNGSDFLSGGVGDDMLYGGNAKDWLNGGDGADTLAGGNGSDVLKGGLGADLLTGGWGTDAFVFDSLDAVDTIADFRGVDEIQLAAGVFADLVATDGGQLAEDCFSADPTTGPAHAYIGYDASTGALFYDRDGFNIGEGAVQFAQLDGQPTVTAGDLVLFPG